MSTNRHILNKKKGGTHTTHMPGAYLITKAAVKLEEVYSYSYGIIVPTKSNVRGKKRIRFTLMQGFLLVRIREVSRVQEVRIYTRNPTKTISSLEHFAEGKGFEIERKEPQASE